MTIPTLREALEAEVPTMAAINAISEWIGFSASTIRSGESWSPTCETMRQAARDGLAVLSKAAVSSVPVAALKPLVDAVNERDAEADRAGCKRSRSAISIPYAVLAAIRNLAGDEGMGDG